MFVRDKDGNVAAAPNLRFDYAQHRGNNVWRVQLAPVLLNFGDQGTYEQDIIITGKPREPVTDDQPDFYQAYELGDPPPGWSAYTGDPITFTLDPTPGTHTVVVEYMYPSTAVETYTETIDYYGMAIDDGATKTMDQNVNLRNFYPGAPLFYRASEDINDMGSWIAYDSNPVFAISSGYGTKTIYFQVQYALGEITKITSKQIEYVTYTWGISDWDESVAGDDTDSGPPVPPLSFATAADDCDAANVGAVFPLATILRYSLSAPWYSKLVRRNVRGINTAGLIGLASRVTMGISGTASGYGNVYLLYSYVQPVTGQDVRDMTLFATFAPSMSYTQTDLGSLIAGAGGGMIYIAAIWQPDYNDAWGGVSLNLNSYVQLSVTMGTA